MSHHLHPDAANGAISRAVVATTAAIAESLQNEPKQSHPNRNPALQRETSCNATLHEPTKHRRKIRTQPAALCPRQLAAARLFTDGLTVAEVALRLKLSRVTLWRWRNELPFRLELQRLHNARAVPVSDQSSKPPAPTPVTATNSVTRFKNLVRSMGFGDLLHEKPKPHDSQP